MPEPSDPTSSAEASLASPSPKQGRGRRSATLAGSGRSLLQCSMPFGHRSCSSKTSPGCGRPDCGTCWPILPFSGSMRSGVISARKKSARPTAGAASSLWPTPMAADSGRGSMQFARGNPTLRGAVATWPTPTVTGNHNRAGASAKSGDGLATAVMKRLWPTPLARAPVVPGGQDLAHAESIGPQQRGGLEPGEDCEAGRDVHQWVVEPDVGRVADGVPARTHRLRLLGNACVPAQAALAWRTLIARAAA
jgi:hypothetical protein